MILTFLNRCVVTGYFRHTQKQIVKFLCNVLFKTINFMLLLQIILVFFFAKLTNLILGVHTEAGVTNFISFRFFFLFGWNKHCWKKQIELNSIWRHKMNEMNMNKWDGIKRPHTKLCKLCWRCDIHCCQHRRLWEKQSGKRNWKTMNTKTKQNIIFFLRSTLLNIRNIRKKYKKKLCVCTNHY